MDIRLLVNDTFSICCCSVMCLLVICSVIPNLGPVYSSTDVFERDGNDDVNQDNSSESTDNKSEDSNDQENSEDESDNGGSNSNDNQENNSNDDDANDSVDNSVNTQKWADFKSTITNASNLNSEISKSGEFRTILAQYNGSQTVFARLSGAAVGDTTSP
jgi:hypothetical protein